jgi:hypothetical protein
MITVGTVQGQVGQEVEIPISSDLAILGCQFVVQYDPTKLTYVSHWKAASGSVNDSLAGQLRCSIADAAELAQTFFKLTFTVHATAEVSVTGIPEQPLLAVDLLNNEYTPEVTNGGVLTGGTMQVKITWTDPNPPSLAVLGSKVFEGRSPTDTFGLVADVPIADGLELIRDVDEMQGNLYYYVVLYNDVGDADPSTLSAPLDTDIIPAAAENVTVVIL